ncbi:hypothetical protein CGRA01v4_12904 [Colletotrichum graminicola]|uniref:Uncharacterized protein n=1 Tax=Colletotrichum graminicola (strain M1.001 / M2 / FGSC 10212) TaxID=645133 RepID=E3QJ02_COLGM|nr:uncharacterized protein GLRG_05984 [Colletotrichum graminicola M1.001]EFQ30840.1 hypothetical protein GLRG_05984 [Colletotrichum graminicola M1.001]WDK21613.1 hypothetical protein CGRA01v4_12904 [Colletotrichum graminicola]
MTPHQYQADSKLVGEKYEIRSHKVSGEYLDVYVVADERGTCFEAQAFAPVAEMPREREGLRQARRRRMRRICGSPNFADEFEHGGRRFLVSRVERSGKEWPHLQGLCQGRRTCAEREVLPREQGAICGEQQGGYECRAPAEEALNQQQRRSSYAEAAVSNKAELSGGIDAHPTRKRMCLTLGSLTGFKRYTV